MKQFDYEASNYKYKEDIKGFVLSFNDSVDKFVKLYENRDRDLKRVTASIDKKVSAVDKLDITLADLAKKTDELKALKELSNREIEELNTKKSEIAYTDSEVQKMELDDINSQIAQKKSKITKVDAKLDTTKAKVKTSNEEKKACEKELKGLTKEKIKEEEALFKAESILSLLEETKEEFNQKVVEIITKPYTPIVEEPKASVVLEEKTGEVGISEEDLNNNKVSFDDIPSVLNEESHEEVIEEKPAREKEDKKQKKSFDDSLLEDMFKKEGIDINEFSNDVREKMNENSDTVINNMDILKKHNVPLEYTVDQTDIYYDITGQDLDDLLSIITTDEDGNGMGFSIDFTYNILNELSKINVDRLIDVYNSEFMNVNAKSGIIHLLKLTNPGLVDFEKNRNANIEILKSIGANNVDEITRKYPDFVNMDNPLFINVLNVFDRNDLVEKLNTDIDVIPKIIDYWKNN